jgi:RNA polymerase sigma factor (sigma-70 family)
LRHPGFALTTLPFEQPSCERHPLSVSSGCHNCPVDNESSASAEDGSGLDAIFRAHKPGLFRFFQRQVGHDEASDLVQDVFARVAGSAQRNHLLNPGGFLRRIAQNLLIDRSRKLARNNVVMLPLAEAYDAPSPAGQEHELHAQDLLAIYDETLRAMPEKTRRVFLMHRVDECSYRQIHESLGISIATVEYHMMKALTQIAEAVDAAR